MDLRKAYDTVNRKILLDKLEADGISSCAFNWFIIYLSSRIQRVRLGDTVSEPNKMTIGIPQGSVLRGLLFCVCINDLPRVLESLFTVFFADETCISLTN